ncbi:hypothetical protein TNCV_2826281, partial [Trichonephila clavipes]
SCRLGWCRENGIIEHRWCDAQVCPDVGQELWRSWSRRPRSIFVCYARIGLGDERRALVGENLGRALKKRDLDGGGPRLGWKERRDPERQWRWRTRDHERRWRWRARIQGLERFVLSDKGLI